MATLRGEKIEIGRGPDLGLGLEVGQIHVSIRVSYEVDGIEVVLAHSEQVTGNMGVAGARAALLSDQLRQKALATRQG